MGEKAVLDLEQMRLTQLIEALRLDLEESARRRNKGFQPLFKVETVTVEAEVMLNTAWEGKAGAGVKVFLSLNAKGSRTRGSRAKISVTLKAVPSRKKKKEDDVRLFGLPKTR